MFYHKDILLKALCYTSFTFIEECLQNLFVTDGQTRSFWMNIQKCSFLKWKNWNERKKWKKIMKKMNERSGRMTKMEEWNEWKIKKCIFEMFIFERTIRFFPCSLFIRISFTTVQLNISDVFWCCCSNCVGAFFRWFGDVD